MLRRLEGVGPAEYEGHAAALAADGQLRLQRRHETVVSACTVRGVHAKTSRSDVDDLPSQAIAGQQGDSPAMRPHDGWVFQ